MAVVFDTPATGGSGFEEEVWARIARGYAAFGSPFVPCRADIAAFEDAVNTQASLRPAKGLQAVMLGVTPGLALMRWPVGSRILAVEISQSVIKALWPGDVPQQRQAVCASWFAIPRGQQSCDVVVGDGSLATCRFPSEVRALSRAVHHLLSEGGSFVFRSYLRPQVQESVESVFGALFQGAGMSVDCFKMRLYLAMQRSPQEGVAVRDAARILDKYQLNSRTMRERLGWSSAAIGPFEAWRNSDAVYSFPTPDELREVLGECFDEESATYATYELAQCCPTLVMRSKSRARGARGGGW